MSSLIDSRSWDLSWNLILVCFKGRVSYDYFATNLHYPETPTRQFNEFVHTLLPVRVQHVSRAARAGVSQQLVVAMMMTAIRTKGTFIVVYLHQTAFMQHNQWQGIRPSKYHFLQYSTYHENMHTLYLLIYRFIYLFRGGVCVCVCVWGGGGGGTIFWWNNPWNKWCN